MSIFGPIPLLVFALPAMAQSHVFPPEKLERIRAGIAEIYNMEYTRAEQRFLEMARATPGDGSGYAYLALTYMVRELTDQQELSIDRFASSDFFSKEPKYIPKVKPEVEKAIRDAAGRAVQLAKARVDRNPGDREAVFVLGLAHQALSSFEASIKRSWWGAFLEGRKTYRLHRELLRMQPDFIDARLSIGVFDYAAGRIPGALKPFAFLFGHLGNQERGKRSLELVAEKGLLAADDARVVLILIATRERDFQRAFDHLVVMRHKYPKNYLVPLEMGGIAMRMNRPEVAEAIYHDALDRRRRREPGFAGVELASLYNRLGVACREFGRLEQGLEWLRLSLAESGSSARTRAIAHLETGKLFDLLERRSEALNHYGKAIEMEDVAGSREEARGLLRTPYRLSRTIARPSPAPAQD